MARKARTHPKSNRQPTFLRAWRRFRGMTMIQVSDRLDAEFQFALSDSQLSRIEKGEQPYSQDVLEMLARVYRTAPASLLIMDPARKDSPWALIESVQNLSEAQRRQAVRVLAAIAEDGTGTDG